MDTDGGATGLAEMLDISHADAQFLLRKFSNDASRAVEEYFNNSDILKQVQPARGWEEPPPYHNAEIPAFRIDASDNVASNVRGAAPSRPPSRASFGGEHIDLTAEHRAADPHKSLSSQDLDREDHDLEVALALSRAQPPPGQENGVTGAGQHFGRARGEYHDTERWTMTVSKASEVVKDPPATQRQRQPGQPAFLKASTRPGAESIAALLTIYHSIPLAREALLLLDYQQPNYGYDPQWWGGRPIDAPRRVPLEENETQYNHDVMLMEVQRLMAFLDATNRAYAGTNTLADLRIYQKVADSELSHFVEAWVQAAMMRSPDNPLTQIFSFHGIRKDVDGGVDKYFYSLEPGVNPEIEQTFTDVLDDIIWSDQLPKAPLNDIWLDKIADVMTFRLSDPERKQGRLGVSIPAVWYPDRYMEHFREASREMRVRRQAILHKLSWLDRSKNEILGCLPNGRQRIPDIKKVLSEAAERAPFIIKNQPQHIASSTSNAPISTNEVSECVRALQDLAQKIDAKVAQLEAEKEELSTKLRATTDELTLATDDPTTSPHHRYTLRGVSTQPNVTYILRQANRDGGVAEENESTLEVEEWWRISLSSQEASPEPSVVYGPQPRPPSDQGSSVNATGPFSPWPASSPNHQINQSSSQPSGNVIAYTICKVSERDVLTAAGDESDAVTLVYASDKAVNFQGSPLAGPLQTFIKADNKVFDSELRGIDRADGPGPAFTAAADEEKEEEEEMVPLQFPSLDGMHDIPLNDDSDETMDGESEDPSSSSREKSTQPGRRGADGQPSPKRARADDEPPSYHDANSTHHGLEMEERSGGMGAILGAAVRSNLIGQRAENMLDRVLDEEEKKR